MDMSPAAADRQAALFGLLLAAALPLGLAALMVPLLGPQGAGIMGTLMLGLSVGLFSPILGALIATRLSVPRAQTPAVQKRLALLMAPHLPPTASPGQIYCLEVVGKAAGRPGCLVVAFGPERTNARHGSLARIVLDGAESQCLARLAFTRGGLRALAFARDLTSPLSFPATPPSRHALVQRHAWLRHLDRTALE